MRFKIPARYIVTGDIARLLSNVLRSNGLNPSVTVSHGAAGTLVELEEANIPAGVRSQMKAVVLPLLDDTSADQDLTV